MSAPSVRRATVDDWAAMRQIRLQALRDAPLAFASTYDREVDFGEDVWRSRTQTAAQFLAEADGRIVGTATGVVDRDDLGVGRLVAMFVVPEGRGRGVAGRLVDAVVADARDRGFAAVVLDVVETNVEARRAYERYGFTPTGVTHPLPHAPELTEVQLQLPLS